MKKWYKIGRQFSRRLRTNNASAYASSIAFFLFLSMIPILMIICSVLPYTPLTEANLMTILMEILPEAMDPMVVSLVSQVYDKSAGVLSFAIIMTIWSAGQGMLALMRALNVANEVVEERGYLKLRILSSFYTIIVLAAILLTLCMGVFGKQLFAFIMKTVPILENILHFVSWFRYLFIPLFLVLAFMLMYTYVPNRKLKLRNQITGAVFSALGWMACSYAFSLYVQYFNAFSAYGSLGTIIVFLLWLYFYCYILLVGAHLNEYFQPVNKFLYQKYTDKI